MHRYCKEHLVQLMIFASPQWPRNSAWNLKDLEGPTAQRVKQKCLYKGPEIIHSKVTQREPVLHMLHFSSPIK